jgi:hypothetical protein
VCFIPSEYRNDGNSTTNKTIKMATIIIYLISAATIIFVPYCIGEIADRLLNLWLSKLEKYILGGLLCGVISTLFTIIIRLSDLLIKIILN